MSDGSNHRFVTDAEDTNTYKYVQKSEESSPQYVQPETYSYPVRRRYNGYSASLRVPMPLGDVLPNPIVVAKADFTGKVGVAGSTITFRGIRAPKGKMYVAPLAKAKRLLAKDYSGYNEVAMLINQASALTANKVPWSAVAYGYRFDRSGQSLRAVLLLPKSFQYLKEKHSGASGPFRADKIRIFFYQDLLPGFIVGETYQFHIEVLRPGQ